MAERPEPSLSLPGGAGTSQIAIWGLTEGAVCFPCQGAAAVELCQQQEPQVQPYCWRTFKALISSQHKGHLCHCQAVLGHVQSAIWGLTEGCCVLSLPGGSSYGAVSAAGAPGGPAARAAAERRG